MPTLQPGLCAGCRHRRDIVTKTSIFVLCGKSRTDPSFPRYPRLPVLDCRGFEPRTSGSETEPVEPGE